MSRPRGPAFFPIDGELFGNQQYHDAGAFSFVGDAFTHVPYSLLDGATQATATQHNYHFTYELHTNFTYQTGQTFAFSGDDDLWVFVNGKLAIDLGGSHTP